MRSSWAPRVTLGPDAGPSVGVGVGVEVAVGGGVSVGVGVGDGVSVAVGEDDGSGMPVAVGLGTGDGDEDRGEEVEVADGDGVVVPATGSVAVDVGVGVAEPTSLLWLVAGMNPLFVDGSSPWEWQDMQSVPTGLWPSPRSSVLRRLLWEVVVWQATQMLSGTPSSKPSS